MGLYQVIGDHRKHQRIEWKTHVAGHYRHVGVDDGVAKATYVIYDLTAGNIELRRLDYDIGKTQEKVLKAGLPKRLADRLAEGR